MNEDSLASRERPVAAVIHQLRERFGERCATGQAVRDQHGKDVSFHPLHAPDAVVFAESTEEVAAVARLCHAASVPMIPFGTGTSCEGGVAALHGGICIDLSRMNAVLEIHEADFDCRVQAGLTRKQLNAALHGSGLHFPIDPGADASIGGMVSTRASGTNAVRYGTMRESVMSLEVVLPDGEVVRTGGRARKSAAGYDLTHLFTGAEGTLGIVTEVGLRLHPLPEQIAAARCGFPDLRAAIDAVTAIMQTGVPVGRIEFLDAQQVEACNRYAKLGLPVMPTLFLEFHGAPESVAQQVRVAEELAAEHGGVGFAWADTPEARSRLWQARHDVWWAALALRPGCQGMPTDACVPISRLSEAVLAARADVEELGLTAPMCGHVGDGNFHLCVVVDPDDADEMARAETLNARLMRRAIAMGGTCTGEHGIGYGKLDFLELERGASMRVMAAIKQALDPRGVMNPGKVLRQRGV